MTTPSSPKPFIVAVRDLPTHRDVSVDGEFVAGVLRGHPLRDALGDTDAGAATLDVELYADGTNVYAHGSISGHVVVACSRCVGPAKVPIEEALRITFMPQKDVAADDEADEAAAGAAAEGDDDGAVTSEAGDDVDVFPFDGERVDLEPLIREQLVLAVPYAPLCKETCAGLCPQCGIDRNVETCTCEKPIDPRFEALKGLKLPS